MNVDLVTREEFDRVIGLLNTKINELQVKSIRQMVPITEAAKQLGVSTRTVKRRFQTVQQGRKRYVRIADLG